MKTFVWTLFASTLMAFASLPSAQGAIIVRDDDFSTDTRADYTDLGIYFAPDRIASDWTVSGGVLNVVGGREGMLAIEAAGGGLLATPNHFSISYSFDPTTVDSQDHPGIAFDRNATNTRIFYLRTHQNQTVGAFTTNPNGATFGPTPTTPGLSVGTSYDLVFDVNFLTQVASVEVSAFGGGPVITSATITGTDFTTYFGTNTGGAFGLVGFDSEGASIDNLVVIDFTQDPPVAPEPGSCLLLGLGLVGLARRRAKKG